MCMKQRVDHEERHKYACHKGKAKHRGILFDLTYEQWWDIWQKSGHWEERGPRLDQYCMSRIADKGGYEIGNVLIQLTSANKREGNLGRKIPRTTEHQERLTAALKEYYATHVSAHKGKSTGPQPKTEKRIAGYAKAAEKRRKKVEV